MQVGMAHIIAIAEDDLIDGLMPSRDDKKPERADKSDILSNSSDGQEVGDLQGGTLSENDVTRRMRRPVLGAEQVFEMAQASIDKRYYFVYASRIDTHVTARWIGKERRR